MFEVGKTGSLTSQEKQIVKRLLLRGWKNQDIQALINLARPATINSGRITSVKKDPGQKAASEEEVEKYIEFKHSFDSKTGLSPFTHERLIKSRDAMRLAVHAFNNPSVSFRAETFSVLANISWTYLAHEYAERNSLPTHRKDGKAISLADFVRLKECPFSDGVKNNLRALIKLRDMVEHRLLGAYDSSWTSIFQANCVNYENTIVKLFGRRLSLSSELSFALQFSGLSIGQAVDMSKSRLPEHIKSINAELYDGLSEEQKNDVEFQFSVIYTTVASSKAKAAINFVSPDSKEGKEIANVLVKHKPSDITHPYRVKDVVKEVVRRTKKNFNTSDHTAAWKKFKVRPSGAAPEPGKTNQDFCYYNPIYRSYSYNEAWIEKLCDFVIDAETPNKCHP